MSNVIKLEEVSRIYGFGNATTVALDEVSLEIEKGEFVAIMGPSGSGKSSLLNIIGLLDRPTHGTYHLSGRLVSKLRPGRLAKTRRDHIGFIFQSFNLLPKLTTIDNVALPLAYKGVSLTKRLEQASAALDRVGLKEKEFYYPKTLSGGQAQRVAIARALVNNPSLIIADEPTGNLDSHSSRVVMEILAELHTTGSTVLMVTHNPELTRYATRVLYMVDGSITHDQQTKLGEVPSLAKSDIALAKDYDNERLQSISAFMQEVPAKPAPERANITRSDKKSKKPKKIKRASRGYKAKSQGDKS
ncbi:ABC transporter ATP-binding protein [Candidatus Saccharibacteria bacterium]|nr:ABC transporter ATP-binding protein [Candidatus Saccharibacteria bacterium]